MNIHLQNQVHMIGACLTVAQSTDHQPVWKDKPPADFTTAFPRTTGIIKSGGFPPFVVHVSLVPFKEGFITSTRPDGGYWSKRARIAPDGYVRHGNSTFAMKATEVVGDAKKPYIQAMFGPDLSRRLSGGVIIGLSEPVGEWQLFLWTPR